MNKLEYLKNSLVWGCYKKLHWMFSAFARTNEPADKWKEDPYQGRLVREPWGVSFVNKGPEGDVLVKITDSKPDEPLFAFLDVILIDASWIKNCKAPTETLVGALICNQILLVENFGDRIGYIAENLSISKIEAEILKIKEDPVPGKPRDPSKIYASEWLRMGQGIELLKMTPSLSVSSVTERNLLPADGFSEFKEKLLKKYEGKLSDPVQLAAFEKEELEFDAKYMSGDPTWGKLMSGKVHKNGRRKLFLSSGAEGGLRGGMVPITESLVEGVPLNPKNFAAIVNASRSGSYFRGMDTIKGGVSAKIAIRVFATFKVIPGDCGSTLGVERYITKYTVNNLVGRTLVGANKPVETINEASNYLGKLIRTRSPAFCKTSGERFCAVCAGPRLASYAGGLMIPATNLTSAVMAASMAAMHKNTTTAATFKLEDVIS